MCDKVWNSESMAHTLYKGFPKRQVQVHIIYLFYYSVLANPQIFAFSYLVTDPISTLPTRQTLRKNFPTLPTSLTPYFRPVDQYRQTVSAAGILDIVEFERETDWEGQRPQKWKQERPPLDSQRWRRFWDALVSFSRRTPRIVAFWGGYGGGRPEKIQLFGEIGMEWGGRQEETGLEERKTGRETECWRILPRFPWWCHSGPRRVHRRDCPLHHPQRQGPRPWERHSLPPRVWARSPQTQINWSIQRNESLFNFMVQSLLCGVCGGYGHGELYRVNGFSTGMA